MKRFRGRAGLVALLILLAIGLLGCAQLPWFSSEPDPELTPTAALVTPPAVVDFAPQVGEELAPDAALLSWRFDQPMDRASVVAALDFTPPLEGAFSWQDDRTLIFRPQALTAGTRYQVILDAGARAATGATLQTPLQLTFRARGALQVTRFSPAQNSTDARVDAPVLVAFNRPIVPLNCSGVVAGRSGCPDLSLSFSPSVMGRGIWVSPSVYRFDPHPGWAAGQLYTVRLASGVESIMGATLEGAVSWSFTTAIPRVLSLSPAPDVAGHPLESAVRVLFNTPMDTEATASAFVMLSETGDPVPGTLLWEDNGATLVFTPTELLALDTRYTVRIGERSRALTSAPLVNPQQWDFTTAATPAPLALLPAPDAEGVPVAEPVRITFAGALTPEAIADFVIITPTVPAEALFRHWDDNTLTLDWEKAPRTTYCVAVRPGIPDWYGNTSEASLGGCFTTGDWSPFVAPATDATAVTLDASAPPELYFVSRNVDSLELTLTQLDEATFAQGRGTGEPERQWSAALSEVANTYALDAVALTVRSAALSTGYYDLAWTPATSPGAPTHLQLAVVDRNLTLKLTAEEALVWVTDLRSGAPITRTEVRLVDHEGLLMAAGTTDRDGVARIRIGPLTTLRQRVLAVVGTPGAAGFGVAASDWSQGASAAQWGLPEDQGPFTPYQVYLQTDRTAYHPGQAVQFHGVVRRQNGGSYAVPERITSVQVRLRGPSAADVYTRTLALSPNGTFQGAMVLPERAGVGDYRLELFLPNRTLPWQRALTVTAYEPPAFELTLRPETTELAAGETLRVAVTAASHQGLPLADAALRWTARAVADDFAPLEADGWAWSGLAVEALSAGESIASGEMLTSTADGLFLLEIPTPATAVAQLWRIEAQIAGVTQQTTVRLHPADFYLGVRPQAQVVAANDRVVVEVQAVDWAGQPVTDVEVAVELVRRVWYEEEGGGIGGATWAYTDTPVASGMATTTGAGVGELALTPPQSGHYLLVATAEDGAGGLLRAESQLWVSGPEAAAWRTEPGAFTPIADVVRYQPGDTARILLPLPFEPPFQALMTVEQDGILHVERLRFETANPVVTLPISEGYVPNVYVSFVVIKGVAEGLPVPEVRLGAVNLPVVAPEQQLDVALSLDRATYRPGDVVTVTVRTSDATGQPVAAEVTLAVGEATPGARLGMAEDSLAARFYGQQPSRVLTGNTLLYLFERAIARFEQTGAATLPSLLTTASARAPVGADDAASAAMTAYWNGALLTDETGLAQVSFTLPDVLTDWVVEVAALTAAMQVGRATTELAVAAPLQVRPVTPHFFVAGDYPMVAARVYNHTDQPLPNVVVALAASGAEIASQAVQTVTLPAGGWTRAVWSLRVPQSGAAAAQLRFSVLPGATSTPAAGQPGEAQLAAPIYHVTTPILYYTSPDLWATGGILAEADTRLVPFFAPTESGVLTLRVEPSLTDVILGGWAHAEALPAFDTEAVISQILLDVRTYTALVESGADAPEVMAALPARITTALTQLYAAQCPDGGWGWGAGTSDLQVTAYAMLSLVEAQEAGLGVSPSVLARGFDFLARRLDFGGGGVRYTQSHALALYALARAGQPWPGGAFSILYTNRTQLGVTGQACLALTLQESDPDDTRIQVILDDLRAEAVTSSLGVHWNDSAPATWASETRATAMLVTLLAQLAPEDPLLPEAVRWLLTTRTGGGWATRQETAWALYALTEYLALTTDVAPRFTWEGQLNGELLAISGVTQTLALGPAVVQITATELLAGQVNVLELTRDAGPGLLYYGLDFASTHSPLAGLPSDSRGVILRRAYCLPDSASDMGILAPCAPVTQVEVGDLVEVRLTLILPELRHYLALEDPYPAGLEPLPSSVTGPSSTWDPFESRDLLADRARFLARDLPPGTYQVRYQLRAVTPGAYGVLPATATEAYFSEVWGRTAGYFLEVLP